MPATTDGVPGDAGFDRMGSLTPRPVPKKAEPPKHLRVLPNELRDGGMGERDEGEGWGRGMGRAG